MTKETRRTATTLSPMPVLATILCSVLLLVSIFLPYIVAVGDVGELYENMGMSGNMSLYNMARQEMEYNAPEFAIMLGIYAAFSALALLFSVLKKPVGILISEVPAMGLAVMFHLIYSTNTVVRRGLMAMGIGDKLIFIAGVALFVCAIWLLVVKVKIKKARKQRARRVPEDV